MKFVSWNVNGLRACLKKGFLESMSALDADFICLQETKMEQGQAQVDLNDGIKIEYIPLVVTKTGIELAKGEEKEAILKGFAERSVILQDDEKWNAAWVAFCESMPNYLPAASEAFTDIPEGESVKQIFPHYLDCEAHLDVWKTIFQTWHAEKTSNA